MPLLSPVPEKKIKSSQVAMAAANFSPEPSNTSCGLGQTLSFEDGHIRVACRVRPPSAREAAYKFTNDEGARAAQAKAISGDEAIEIVSASGRCLTVLDDHTTLVLNSKPTPKIFTFDYAIHETATQEEIFATVGKPISNACLEGYNSTMLAYGQTGSGKSFTMFGPESGLTGSSTGRNLWGIVPRSIDYLFSQIARETRRSNGEIKFTCKSSFFEIFNERVFDLLDAANTDTHSKERQSNDRSSRGSRNSSSMLPEDISGLQVREDQTRGVYVDGLNEAEVACTSDAIKVLEKGYRNRRVAETAMNRESSRSHAVFQLQVKSVDQSNPNGKRKSSLFTLVDLAGSERQSGTSAAGDRLKEANAINKSLSSLGQVINALVDRGQGKTRHVPYRDSKLISPCDEQFGESLSTLKFSQRAKMITNSAVVNEDIVGNTETLKLEVARLKQELAKAKIKNNSQTSSDSGSTSNDVNYAASLAPAEVDEVLALSLQRFVAIHKQSERYLEKTKALRMLNEKSMNQLQVANYTIKVLRSKLDNTELVGIGEKEAKMMASLEHEMLKMNEANKWMTACNEMRREINALSGKEDVMPSLNNLSGFVKDGAGSEFLKELCMSKQARDKSLGLSNGRDPASKPWTEDNEIQFQIKLQEKFNKAIEEKEAVMGQLQAIMDQKAQVGVSSIMSPNSSGDEECKSMIAAQFGDGKDAFNLLDDIAPASNRRISAASSRRSSVGRLGRLSVGGDVSQWSSNLESNKKIREAEMKADVLSKQLHEKSLELAEANKLNSVLQREKAEILAGESPEQAVGSSVTPDETVKKLESSLESCKLEVDTLREEIERLGKARLEDQEAAEAAEAQLHALAQAEMEESARQKQLASEYKASAAFEAAQAEASALEVVALRKAVEVAKQGEDSALSKIKDLEDELETLTQQVEYTKSSSLEKSKEIQTLKEEVQESSRQLDASKRLLESQKDAFAAMKDQLLASSRADTEGCLQELNQQLSSQAEKLATSLEEQESTKEELASTIHALTKAQDMVRELQLGMEEAKGMGESASAVAEELRNEVWGLREEVSKLESSKANLEAELASVSDDREEVVASLNEAERVAEEAREVLEAEKANYLEELQRQAENISDLEEALESEQQMMMDATAQHQKEIASIEAAWNSKIDVIKAQESAAMARAEQAEAEVGVLRKDTQRDVQESEKELLATKHTLKCEQEAHSILKRQCTLQAAKLEEQMSTVEELTLQVKQLQGERESLLEKMIQNDVAIEAAQREAKHLKEVVLEKDKVLKELTQRLNEAEVFGQEMELVSKEAEDKVVRAMANAEQSKQMEQEVYERALELERENKLLAEQLEQTSMDLEVKIGELAEYAGHTNSKQRIQILEKLKFELNTVHQENKELKQGYDKVCSRLRMIEAENDHPPSSSTKRSKTPAKSPVVSKSPCVSPLIEKDANIAK